MNDFLLPVGLVGVAAIIRWLLDPLLGDRAVFITIFPAVAGAVYFRDARAGIIAAVLGAMVTLFLEFRPRDGVVVDHAGPVVSLAAFLLASGIVIALGHNLQQSTKRSRNAEHLLQAIIDGLPALVSLIDRQYRYCLANAEYPRWFGISEPELLGKSVEEVLGAESFAKLKPRMDRAFEGETVSFREFLPYAHGGAKWVQITYRPHLNAAGLIDAVVVLVQDVSVEHKAEEALAEREREFRAIFELNATGTAAVDATTGRFILVNEKFAELTGYSREELLGLTFYDITHPEDRARDRERYRTALQSPVKNFESEKRYVRKDGEIRWVMVRGTILRDDHGRAVQTLATILDLTEWKRNQEALMESERRLRQALEAGDFGTWEWIIPENRVIFSDRLYEIYGLKPEDLSGDLDDFRKMIHPEDWDKVHGSVSETLEKQVPYQLEFRGFRRNGEMRWLWTTAQVFYEGKQPVKMVGITSDITDRKRIEIQLRASEERLRLAQRAAKVGTWDWLLKENKVTWSEGVYDMLGLYPSQDPPTLEEWLTYVHPDDRGRLRSIIPDVQARGGPFSVEFRVTRTDGAVRWILGIGRTEKNSKGEAVRMLGVNVDITERKKAEVLLQSQAQHLEELVQARTERLEEVITELESFSYTIAHDLRGPLRAMNGFATALDEEYSPLLDDTARDYIRRITTAAERMDRLICDVLDYSKITRQPFAPEPVALDPLIDGILESYPGLQTGGVAVHVTRPLPTVLGTSALLVQVFSNLIGNAVKFVRPDVEPRIAIRSEHVESGKVRIWVEDNGIGISRENYERIFGLFQRLNKSFEGTGIGLSIVSRAVDRMGGSVGLLSEEGVGSKFWVELKEAEQAIPAKQNASEDLQGSATHSAGSA